MLTSFVHVIGNHCTFSVARETPRSNQCKNGNWKWNGTRSGPSLNVVTFFQMSLS